METRDQYIVPDLLGVEGLALRIWDQGFGVYGSRFRISGFRSRGSGLGLGLKVIIVFSPLVED